MRIPAQTLVAPTGLLALADRPRRQPRPHRMPDDLPRKRRISGARRRLHRLPHRARGQAFAGGRRCRRRSARSTTSNITPDPGTGIGTWTADDFYKTMHNGRFPDGGLLYPAMPFASYTKVTRAD